MRPRLKKYKRTCKKCLRTFNTSYKFGAVCEECYLPSGRRFRKKIYLENKIKQLHKSKRR